MRYAALWYPVTKVTINQFTFSLRPNTYALYLKDSSPYTLLGKIAHTYSPYLSRNNRLKQIYIFDAGEILGTTAGLPNAIAFSFEDFIFLQENPSLHREHLIQVFLHEFGHYVFREGENRTITESMYGAVHKKEWDETTRSVFFALFTDSLYETIPDNHGHPWDDERELFASAFMISLCHSKNLEERIALTSGKVSVSARQFMHKMKEITDRFPPITNFLK